MNWLCDWGKEGLDFSPQINFLRYGELSRLWRGLKRLKGREGIKKRAGFKECSG
jgi:hypothetical protein